MSSGFGVFFIIAVILSGFRHDLCSIDLPRGEPRLGLVYSFRADLTVSSGMNGFANAGRSHALPELCGDWGRFVILPSNPHIMNPPFAGGPHSLTYVPSQSAVGHQSAIRRAHNVDLIRYS